EIEVEPLIKAIQRVSLLASEDNFKVVFNFTKNQLKIHSEDIDKGSAEEILEIENDFEKFQIGFNYKYLIEILQLVDTNVVQIKLENSLDPCIFYNIEYPEDQKNLFLLMPLRIANE
ncbi:MAG: DNA polymerase III subunit beta, partial [Candidatus Cloacimonetes bacterium]|nr:DNA polymerase III subunit beta [Candidatus Cloacimonadota bacterium]